MTTPAPLTRCQLDCARVIAEFADGQGRPPTFRELATELDLASPSSISALVDSLTRKGWLAPRRTGVRSALVLLHRPHMLDFEDLDLEVTPAGRAVAAGAIAEVLRP